MSADPAASFLYDFNSPYAYLAASRIDATLPEPPRWQPIAFAFILRAHDRSPWSFDERSRAIGVAECERRAKHYRLPPIRWPPGWPVRSYGLISLRAALVADEHGLLRRFSAAAFARNFVSGLGLTTVDDLGAVAAEVGLDPGTVALGVEEPRIKQRLVDATESALAAGVVGVPTVLVGNRPFWGDDQLEAAAAALAGDD